MDNPAQGAGRVLLALSEQECYDLLSSDSFGRVVYTRRAMPAVVPVNFLLEGSDVLLRTDPNSSLGRSVDGAVVAFEVDDIDRGTQTGWSVVVVGVARAEREEVPDPDAPQPWAAGSRSLLVRIEVDHISGRRISA